MDYARPELADALAAEYVAGTLRGAARRRFEALLPSHPTLAAAVREWQARLIPLTSTVAPQTPPASVWNAIERRLWPAADAVPAAAPSAWQRLALWRGVAAFATVAALGLGLRVASPPPALPPVVVVLQGTGADGRLAGSFVASVSGDGAALVTRPVQPVSLQADRALELWALPSEGAPSAAPLSLGVISADGTTVVRRDRLPPALLQGGAAGLAVTLEPPGGSPTGKPTGPIVYAGKLQT